MLQFFIFLDNSTLITSIFNFYETLRKKYNQTEGQIFCIKLQFTVIQGSSNILVALKIDSQDIDLSETHKFCVIF